MKGFGGQMGLNIKRKIWKFSANMLKLIERSCPVLKGFGEKIIQMGLKMKIKIKKFPQSIKNN